MKISLIQMNMHEGDTEYNFLHAEWLLKKAAEYSPDVIILPETWNTGFFPKTGLPESADRDALRTKALLRDISGSYGAYIVGGSVTERKGADIYNTCYIYDDKGVNIASYSKNHLFSPMREQLYYKKGDSLCVFSIKGVKCAVCICYDIRFPELIRRLALEGIKILFVPMQWPRERTEQMKLLIRARAVENQIFTVACNSAGLFDGTVFGGCSFVSSPLGEVLDSCAESEEILTVNADISVIDGIKRNMDVFNDRRTELY